MRTAHGKNRREFLKVGALGLGGLTLPDMLRARTTTPADASRGASAEACLYVFLQGGPSQLDCWDPNPNAAGSFGIRQHAATLSWERESEWVSAGRTDTGTLTEQTIWLTEPGGVELAVRRVRLTLDNLTRDGDGVIDVLTNLPAKLATASAVSELYRGRWSVEGLFLRITTVLKCEVNTLGYPPAALFGFCVALASGNVYAGVKGALRAAHGAEVADARSPPELPPSPPNRPLEILNQLHTALVPLVGVGGQSFLKDQSFRPGKSRKVQPVLQAHRD